MTKLLRERIRTALKQFLQGVLDAPENRTLYHSWQSPETASRLWHDGLILVYRLLFILKLEAHVDAHSSFGFVNTAHWRTRYSLSHELAQLAAIILESKKPEASLVQRLRTTCACFIDGVCGDELSVSPLGGSLFGKTTTALLDSLHWDEMDTARLLAALIWESPPKQRRNPLDYAQLEAEDLGGIYEGLLELEPGITREPMVRLRRAKLELVVPLTQARSLKAHQGLGSKLILVEEIPPRQFYVGVGFKRKASGSFYTPGEFARFLIRETLEPQLKHLSPPGDPNPCALLGLKLLDPTMGSGHFLVEACRYLGRAVHRACQECESLALAAESQGKSERATALRGRIDAVRAWLPTNSSSIESWHCRRLVASRCLYGVDRNPLAVELARAALWLQSGDTTLSLDELARHLVIGDSLTGPRLEQLLTLPRSAARVEASRDSHLDRELRARVTHALKREYPAAEALASLRRLAAVWTGSVMLGNEADDSAYLELLWSVLRGDDGRAVVARYPVLQRALELGREGVTYELVFPEVFLSETAEVPGGFDAILGNPPWDAIKFNTKEFLAAYDLRVLEAPTKKERDRVEAELTQSPEVAERFRTYQAGFEQLKRTNDRNFTHQKLMVDGDLAGRQLDAYRVVVERACQLLRSTGYLGLVVPSSFHTAAGAVGVRRLIVGQHRLVKYLSFVNRRKNFDISAGIEFGLLVAAGLGTKECPTLARFGLEDPALLEQPEALALLEYHVASLCRGNPYLSFPSAGDATALATLLTCRAGGVTVQELLCAMGIDLRSTPTSVHMTHEAKYFVPAAHATDSADERAARYANERQHGNVLLHEGSSFTRFSDEWTEAPRFCLSSTRVASSQRWKTLVKHYKIALRAIVGSSREKSIATLLPPGCLVANSALVEGAPEQRSNANALGVVGLFNSTLFNWLLGFYADLNVNLFALKYLPVPNLTLPAVLVHHSLRLCCNHSGFAALWRELLGERWHEPSAAFRWPVLADEPARWAARAEIDAVVAHWYALERRQYEYILSTQLSPSSPDATKRCLTAFDQIASLGLDAFTRRVDPYSAPL